VPRGNILLALGRRRISKLVMIKEGGAINIAKCIQVQVRVVVYKIHHTIHERVEYPIL
jgi:hypothetical protein